MSERDPKIDPQAGDVLINASRTVIRRYDDKIVFGVERDGSMNCGAYTCTLDDWKEWASGSCLKSEDWR